MFSLSVCDTDWFLDLPLSTQALYFHLALRADDDGFVDSPKSILRKTGASANDYDLLVAKRYILKFESGVIVIKHWRMHNTVQRDRYHATQFQSELSTLELKDNKSYTERKCIQNVSKTDTSCIQNVSSGLGLGLDLDINNNTCSKNESFSSVGVSKNELFDMFWSAYPRKIGKQKCINWFIQHKVDTNLVNKMINAINNQKATEQWLKDAGRFIPHPYTWLNRGGWDDEVGATITSVTDEDWSAL